MRISQFDIVSRRSIKRATCTNVPQLMIITGPNGAGKSTLLYELRNVDGRQGILYVGPHRSARRQSVKHRDLTAKTLSYESILTLDDAPGFDGVRVVQGSRDPWNADDAANYLKHSLCQIAIERQESIARRYERDGEIKKDSLPDPWEPLKTLTSSLLPHLRFSRIDTSNRDKVRCVWQVHSKNTEVDLDDLSSGEKAVIQLFYPLLEHRIKGILREIQSCELEEERPETCLLIDEPELHLHPNLQVKMFDYMRTLTIEGNIQVIAVTHSPTIVEAATSDELFLLRPQELVASEENQLVQIAGDDERLALMRDIFGTTSNVTAMQPIVIVEGIGQSGSAKSMSDRKLYRALCPRFDSVTVIPGGGKADCLRLLGSLRELTGDLSSEWKTIALLDRDTTEDSDHIESDCRLLPVSMIENFLLDSQPLWEAIQSVVEKTEFGTPVDVLRALENMIEDLTQEETTRRIKAGLGTYFFRPKTPTEEIPAQAKSASEALSKKYSKESIAKVSSRVVDQITGFKKNYECFKFFHGKNAIDSFYRRHLHNTGLSKNVFKFEAARHARERASVKQFFELFFSEFLN